MEILIRIAYCLNSIILWDVCGKLVTSMDTKIVCCGIIFSATKLLKSVVSLMYKFCRMAIGCNK